MWFKKNKSEEKAGEHQKEIQAYKAKETKRINRATKPMEELNALLEANGITLEIKKAIGTKHG